MSSPCHSLRRQPEFSVFDRSRVLLNLGLMALALLLMGGTLFYIHTQVSAVDLGYRLDEALKIKQKLQEEDKVLNLKIARLKSPQRIESVAKKQLQMGLPKNHQRIYLSQWADNSLALNFSGKTIKKTFSSQPLTKRPHKTLAKTKTKKPPSPSRTRLKATKAKKLPLLATSKAFRQIDPLP